MKVQSLQMVREVVEMAWQGDWQLQSKAWIEKLVGCGSLPTIVNSTLKRQTCPCLLSILSCLSPAPHLQAYHVPHRRKPEARQRPGRIDIIRLYWESRSRIPREDNPPGGLSGPLLEVTITLLTVRYCWYAPMVLFQPVSRH